MSFSSSETVSIISIASSNEDHIRSLGHRVWSIGHLRSSILEHLPRAKQLQLLTLSQGSFPDAVRALHHTIKFENFLRSPLPPWTPTYRIEIYRQSVRCIDLVGSLPACVGFSGGLPRLLEVFPLLKAIDCYGLSFTRFNVDGEARNQVLIKSNIYAGSGNSARLAHYQNGFPKDWAVSVDFDLTVCLFDRFSRSMDHSKKTRTILLQSIRTFKISARSLTHECDACSTPSCISLFHPLERLLEARRVNGSPPIPSIDLDREIYSLTLQEFESVAILCGQSVRHLSAAVTIAFSLKLDFAPCIGVQPEGHGNSVTTLQSLYDILAQIDWSKFVALRTLKLRIYLLIGDWPSAKWLCYPVGHDVTTDSPAPSYTGPHLNLDQFELEVCLAMDTDNCTVPEEIQAADCWMVDYLPAPDDLAQQAVAISGPHCHTTVRWRPAYDDQFEDEEWHCSAYWNGSAITYNYLLRQSLHKARFPTTRGWQRITGDSKKVSMELGA